MANPDLPYDFSRLPLRPLQYVIKFADMKSRYAMKSVCRDWYRTVKMKENWLDVVYDIPGGWEDPVEMMVKISETYGHWHRAVVIRLQAVNSSVSFAANNLLCMLAEKSRRSIRYLTIQCVHHRGPCSHGESVALCLRTFFESIVRSNADGVHGLIGLDLSMMTIVVGQPIFEALFNHQGRCLTCLNIQNKLALCNVSPQLMQTAFEVAVLLQDVRIFMASMDDEAMLSLISNNAAVNFRHLSLTCRYADTRRDRCISDGMWIRFCDRFPYAYVTLIISRGYPLAELGRVLMPHMPLKTLLMDGNIDFSALCLIRRLYPRLLKISLCARPLDFIDAGLAYMALFNNLRQLYVKHKMDSTYATLILNRHPKLIHNLTNPGDSRGYEIVPDAIANGPMLPVIVEDEDSVPQYGPSNLWIRDDANNDC